MKRNPVGWFEIYVHDIERARSFYETLLAVKLETLSAPLPGMDMLTFPMNEGGNGEGASGSLTKMEGGPAPGSNSTIVYFSCEDCATEAGRAESAGGKIKQKKSAIGEHGFYALVTDPDGNCVGLHSMR